MDDMGIQTITGKAFEYACLLSAKKRAESFGIKVNVITDHITKGKTSFEKLAPISQKAYLKAADSAMGFIFSCEPHLHDGKIADELKLSLQGDAKGQSGDVRDMLFMRWYKRGKVEKRWECGISCKHNHDAIKHPRVSLSVTNADFLNNWTGGLFNCSQTYIDVIKKLDLIVTPLVDSKADWKSLGTEKHEIYESVTTAVANEIRNKKDNKDFVIALFNFLLGTNDFYKVIAYETERLTQVSIFNFNGT